jgi:hypothetical protein
VAPEEDAQAQEAQAAEARAPQAQVVAIRRFRSHRRRELDRAAAAILFSLERSNRGFRFAIRGESALTSRSFETHRLDFFVLLP